MGSAGTEMYVLTTGALPAFWSQGPIALLSFPVLLPDQAAEPCGALQVGRWGCQWCSLLGFGWK
jgi:hypothetical protein